MATATGISQFRSEPPSRNDDEDLDMEVTPLHSVSLNHENGHRLPR